MLSGEKLPNSGETLKLMVPNHGRKTIGGWSNYSCRVISHKMSENKMGDRGSKSDLLIKSVKEQRVNGNWCMNKYFTFKMYSNGFRKKLSSQKPF